VRSEASVEPATLWNFRKTSNEMSSGAVGYTNKENSFLVRLQEKKRKGIVRICA
jgi:hypothetical protein